MDETSPVATSAKSRIESIDVLRGVIMILMALDHVRDFFGQPGVNPADPTRASTALFLTRWVTHFCAPVFFLLTGTGAFLGLGRRSRGELSRFLLTRGLWLLVLDAVVVRCLGLQFNFDFQVTILLVLWALGWSMIALAGLVWLPVGLVTAFGVVMIAAHNLFDGISAASLGVFGPLWTVLHVPGFLINTPRVMLLVGYPLIPWIGVTAVGFGLGRVFLWPSAQRQAFLWRLGLALSATFLVLRAINRYGDPFRWAVHDSPLVTLLSFFATNKYPPSLLFLLMTLGPALLALAALDRGTPRWLAPALVVGRVPLFYYLVHWPLMHLLAVAVCLIRYGEAHWMFESPSLDRYPVTFPPGWGFELPGVYLVWVAVVVVMIPLCRWFGAVKRRSGSAWLQYL